ncbi:MAG: OsmC family protein [Steroidobacteraceae bacterium]
MHPFPHVYHVSAASAPGRGVTLASPGLADLDSDGPREFDGPGDKWSPETLLSAALADCYILSFRAVAAASKFEWVDLHCSVEATLDRVEKVTLFTRFTVRARLGVRAGADLERARRLLEKAELVCLIGSSLKGERHLEAEVTVLP